MTIYADISKHVTLTTTPVNARLLLILKDFNGTHTKI